MKSFCSIVGLLLVVVLFCVQQISAQPTKYKDTSCMWLATTSMDCKTCCEQLMKFKGAFMDWDGCYCHN